MEDTVLEFKSITCFICGTDHGVFLDWDGPRCCQMCSNDLFLDGKRIKCIDVNHGAATAWLEDGICVEFANLKQLRSMILEEYMERQRVTAARKGDRRV